MRRVYICSPLGASTEEGIRANMLRARGYAKSVADITNARTYAPHAWLPEMLDDREREERELAIRMNSLLLMYCDALCICGGVVSPGMRAEIESSVSVRSIYHFGTDEQYQAVQDALPGVKINQI